MIVAIAFIVFIVLIVLWLQRYKSYASGASFSGEMGSFILFLGYEKFINRLALAEQDFFQYTAEVLQYLFVQIAVQSPLDSST